MSATNSQSTAASRSRAALPSDYRRVLEASNLPIEQAVAIADMVELALRSESASPCVELTTKEVEAALDFLWSHPNAFAHALAFQIRQKTPARTPERSKP